MTKSRRGKPVVLAVTSDHHVCSTVGLCPPYTQLDDGGEYRASRAQQWLWANWLTYIDRVKDTAKKHEARIVSLFNGDLTEGNHHHTLQVVTNNRTTQMRMTYQVLRGLVEASDKVFVVRGTEAHVGKSASLEEKIAEDISAEKDELTGTYSWWHLPLEINGTLFDFAHHGSLGRLPWTKASATNRIAAQMIVSYSETGDKVPGVIVRSHLHQKADTGDNFRTIRVIATPGWQLKSSYVHRVAPNGLPDIGGYIFTCWPGGRLDVDPVMFWPKRREAIKA